MGAHAKRGHDHQRDISAAIAKEHSRTHPLYRHEVPHHHHTERSQHGSANVRDERDAPRLELEGAERGSHERKLENAANRRDQVQQVIHVGEKSEPTHIL